jgi:uncharacterized membrane protein YhhN
MHRLFSLFLASALAAMVVVTLWPDQWGVFALLKPLTTAVVIVHAAGRGQPGDARRRALLVGLCWSWLGDVALLWPQQGFLPGLLSFLMAHLAYLWALTRGVRLAAVPWAFGAYALLAGGLLSILWPGVPAALRGPVAAYVLCLAGMAAQGACWWWVNRSTAQSTWARWAAWGGLLFVASDALLAFNKFHSPLPLASVWILATYWAAQWLIASALPPRVVSIKA